MPTSTINKLHRNEGYAPGSCHSSILDICVILSGSHLVSQPATPPKKCTIFMGSPPATQHSAQLRSSAEISCKLTSHFYIFFPSISHNPQIASLENLLSFRCKCPPCCLYCLPGKFAQIYPSAKPDPTNSHCSSRLPISASQ